MPEPTIDPPADQSPHDERLQAFIQRINAGHDFPALSDRIRDVMTITTTDDRTMQHLANIILKDFSLTAKVLRTANSFSFNRAGAPIASVTQAMVLLGTDTVRELASSLIVFEHYQRQSPGLKELMLLSMLTATHARETAEATGYARPEEAFLLGMFKNLGEALVACHAPNDYATIIARAKGDQRPEHAAVSVLGFTFDELGVAVSRTWGMTPSAATRPDELAKLDGILNFSQDLTNAVYRRDAGNTTATLAILMQRHGSKLTLKRDALTRILDHGIVETREVFKNLKISFNDLKLRRQSEVALASLDSPDGIPEPIELPEPEPVEAPVEPVWSRDGLIATISAGLSAPEFDLNQTLLTILEAVLRAGPFDRAVFCVANADRTEAIGRFGLGTDVETWLERLRFPVSGAEATEPVGPALARASDLVLSTSRALLPQAARWLRKLEVETLLLFPVTIDGKFVGVLCAQWIEKKPAPDQETLAFVSRARRLVGDAIIRARGGEVPKRTVISTQDRYQAVLRVLKGESAASVAKDVGASADDVEKWRQAFLSGALGAMKKN